MYKNNVIVLSDTETYSNLHGAHLVSTPGKDELAVEAFMAYDLENLLADPAVQEVLQKYRVSYSQAIKDVLADELEEYRE